MIHSTQGIVINSIKYRDTSLIVKIFTHSHGLVSFIVNGVRSSKAKNKAALFQPLTILDIEMYYRDSKNLQRLKEYKIGHIYTSVPFDIAKSSISIFLLEVLNQCIHEEENNEDLYDFFTHAIIHLDSLDACPPNFHLYILCQMMYHLGFNPQGIYSEKTPVFDMREGSFKSHLEHHDLYLNAQQAILFSSLIHEQTIEISKIERKNLLKYILQYYKIHLDSFRDIKSLKVLETVLS